MDALPKGAVVVTGASSGLGRATAEAFARQGRNIVICARNGRALEEAAEHCRGLGARVLAVTADVRVPEDMIRLADRACDEFGNIAVWVNNAGVGAVGRYWEVPIDVHRATVETNLLGGMYGAHAAIPCFLREGQGTLVNIVSVGGLVTTPYAASYAASKFGLRAFSASLRQEFRGWPGIEVCAVFPWFLDTPGVRHGANYTGHDLRPGPFVDRPERIAGIILDLERHPRAETVVGILSRLARLEYQIAPRLTEWGLARALDSYLMLAEPAPDTPGGVLESAGSSMEVHGGWRQPGPSRNGRAVLALALAGVVALALWPRRSRS
jgi:short-subunit dehydrogenase